MLGEVITKSKAAGACAILAGVILTIAGAPATNDDDASEDDGLLTPSDVTALTQRPIGYKDHRITSSRSIIHTDFHCCNQFVYVNDHAFLRVCGPSTRSAAYCALLFAIVFASVMAIKWYEREYPLLPDNATTKSANPMGSSASTFAPAADSSSQLESAAPVISAEQSTPVPAAWLDRVMAVVYPGSLGVDEGIAHLTMKVNGNAFSFIFLRISRRTQLLSSNTTPPRLPLYDIPYA